MIVALAVTLFVASFFAGGFIVAMRDIDEWRAHVDHEEQVDMLWDDDEVAAA